MIPPRNLEPWPQRRKLLALALNGARVADILWHCALLFPPGKRTLHHRNSERSTWSEKKPDGKARVDRQKRSRYQMECS